MSYLKPALIGALCALGVAVPSLAQERGDFIIRGRIIGVLPDEGATITPINGTVEISDEFVPELDFTYFIANNVGIEVIAAIAPHDVKAVDTMLGEVDLGDVTLLPPTVTLQYHFPVTPKLRIYGGVGANFTAFFNEDLPSDSGLVSIDYDESFGFALQAGLDYMINDKWMINLDVKRVDINPDVPIDAGELGIVTADVDIDPYIVGVGIGRKF